MSRPWVLPVVLGGWAALAVLLLVFAPQERALEPQRAAELYGEQRTSFSSADGGVLAFYRLLGRIGFNVRRNAGFELPNDGVLFILEPSIWLDADEAKTVVGWIHAGGRLVYAPRRVVGSYEENGIVREIEVPDPLMRRLDAIDFQSRDDVRFGALGAGRVVVLGDGAWRLSNRVVFERGIGDQLNWLDYITEAQEHLVFDEARAGAMLSDGLLAALFSGRFAWPVVMVAITAILVFWSAVARRMPAIRRSSTERRDDRQLIEALSRAMRHEQRVSVARAALLDGVAGSDQAPEGLVEIARWREEQVL